MKIGIDALYLQSADSPTGLYQYTSRLIDGLQKIDRENEYLLYFFNWRNRKREETIERYRVNPNFKKRICRVPYRALAPLSKVLPISTVLGKVDLFHGPAFGLLPDGFFKKSVVSIHDLKVFYPSELFARSKGSELFRKQTLDAIKRADRVITMSEFTRAELIDRLHLSEERIRVTYLGVGAEFSPAQDGEKITLLKSKYGIKRPYILFVGLIEPKKNLSRLIEAFSEARRSLPQPYQLVIAGPPGPSMEEVLQKIRGLFLEGEVILTGAVPREELPLLYAGAAVFTFPSLQEGFGIPPLEAMASGTPVVASNVTSLPEVIGAAGILVDPLRTEEIAGAIYSVLTDLPLREALKEKGLARSRDFSWEKMARETLQIYREL
jgi:glycosyltransferase involved in cell wall biosynthesis